MKTAREVAHEHVEWACDLEREESGDAAAHSEYCDNLTAAIEARDEAWNLNINQNDRDWESKLAALTAERDRLREALEAIAEYDTNYAVGPAENVNRLQAIAESALKAQP